LKANATHTHTHAHTHTKPINEIRACRVYVARKSEKLQRQTERERGRERERDNRGPKEPKHAKKKRAYKSNGLKKYT